jgi:sporulation protein YlmC with PRC-barrel domain
MKTSKIIGKKVLDCDANDVGKVNDIDIDIKSNSINKIFINTGELSLRKVNFEVTPEMIAQVGDYLLLNVSKSEISVDKPEETPDVEIVNPNEIEEKSKSK